MSTSKYKKLSNVNFENDEVIEEGKDDLPSGNHDDEKYAGLQSPDEDSFAADAPLLANVEDESNEATTTSSHDEDAKQPVAAGPSQIKTTCAQFLVC